MYDHSGVNAQSIELAEQLLDRYDKSGVFRPVEYEYHAFIEVWREATGRLKFNNNCRPCIEQAINEVRRQLERYRGMGG